MVQSLIDKNESVQGSSIMQATLYNNQNSDGGFSPRFESSFNVLKLQKHSIPEELYGFGTNSQFNSALVLGATGELPATSHDLNHMISGSNAVNDAT